MLLPCSPTTIAVTAVGYLEGAVPVAELHSLSPSGADHELAVPRVGICRLPRYLWNTRRARR